MSAEEMQSSRTSAESYSPFQVSLELLRSLIMQAPSLIAVLSGPDFVVELANRPFCEVMGVSDEEQLLHRPLTDVMPEIERQVFLELLQRVYQTGETYSGKEMPALFERNGEMKTVYFNFVYTPFRNANGQIEAVFVIATDVTAEVLAHQQLDSLREAAESANRAKDQFLAMLGHELRNPLSPIVTALHLMKIRPNESERARVVIERQVDHLVRLVDDLSDVSRIARGKVELKRESVRLADVVAKAVEMVTPLVEQRGHSLSIEIPNDSLWVDGDPTRLSQVVSNLLTNAAKYTTRAGEITIQVFAEGDDAVVRVRDTGIGIEPEMLKHVFDLFVQDRQALDSSQGGMGLGLTIVRNLVQLHGGSVAATSEGLGKGSEFIVRLPLMP